MELLQSSVTGTGTRRHRRPSHTTSAPDPTNVAAPKYIPRETREETHRAENRRNDDELTKEIREIHISSRCSGMFYVWLICMALD